MQYSTIFFSILAASGAMAAPSGQGRNNNQNHANSPIHVILRADGHMNDGWLAERQNDYKFRDNTLFKTVELDLLEGFQNKDLRCKIFDNFGDRIVLKRGGNIDITFADADKGPWTIVNPAGSTVSKVVCDPAFQKSAPQDLELSVLLNGHGGQLQFVESDNTPQRIRGAVNSVQLDLTGALVDPEYRCALLDVHGNNVKVSRGANINKDTFGDGKKGPWTVSRPRDVAQVVCDTEFKRLNV